MTFDRVLLAMSMIVGRHLLTGARAGRKGGEQLLTAVPAVEPGQPWLVAETLREALSEADFEGFRDGEQVTISLGGSEGGPAGDAESLLRRADGTLCRA